jgi:hypothetical protein
VRKDIEDAFGILKGRFRILKLPILYQKKEYIDNVVHCCVALHNMLRDWDGLSVWEGDADWKGRDSVFIPEEEEECRMPLVRGREIEGHEDFSRFGIQHFASSIAIQQEYDIGQGRFVDVHVEESTEFFTLQHQLVQHFKVANAKNEVTWLRS